MRIVCRWRRRWTAIALASLATRLLIAAIHVPPAAAATDPEAASLFSQIVLCTASGYRVVKLDADGNPLEPDSSPPLNAGVSCPVCMTLSAAPLAPSPPEIVIPAPRLVAYAVYERRLALVAGKKPLVARGRDPPLQV